MAKSKIATEEPAPIDGVVDAVEPDVESDLEDGEAPETLEDWDAVDELEDVIDDGEEVVDDAVVAVEAKDGSDDEALDELEAEELEMLTDDEASETLVVDEAEELRAIRRAEISMEADGGGQRARDEFVCQSCFLVLKSSQLADKRRKFCRDCAG